MPAVQSQNQHSQSSLVTIVQGVVKRLEDSWNAADGAGFAEPFAVDADFVAIRGDLHTGRRAIGEGHQQIFDTIYAGSTARLEVLQARELDAGVILAHVRGHDRCAVRSACRPALGDRQRRPRAAWRRPRDRLLPQHPGLGVIAIPAG
jgi:uncharacterized protein (TIGR02246 family)